MQAHGELVLTRLNDAQSIAPIDIVATDLVYRDYLGESYLITYNPTHQWFYFPQMQPSEALLFKCFDSAKDGRGLLLTLGLMTQ
ncbi:MAG: hypothetical protein V7K40_17120 [Nostoc sp.]|uniref:hypothetical protein n=1 Tax=Nostoc sp. TaxID=1180 RepID=UPI002FF65717